jgi:hypothetical protein
VSTDIEPFQEMPPQLAERQIRALEQLHALGQAPRGPDEPYSKDAKVRALQLIYEGRLGGSFGGGRPRQPRAAEVVAEHVRKQAKKITRVLDDALDDDNIKVRLSAADMALKIEREEASLQLEEDKADLEQLSKEELVGTLFQLVQDPHTTAVLEGTIELPPEAIVEEEETIQDEKSTGTKTKNSSHKNNGAGKTRRPTIKKERVRPAKRNAGKHANNSTSNGSNGGPHSRNGRGAATGNRAARSNPFAKTKN